MIKNIDVFINQIDKKDHQDKFRKLIDWINLNYPQLESHIKWNQPMFTDHGTYIIGFSVSKKHIAMSPEQKTLHVFKSAIEKAGYDYGKMIIRIPWTEKIDFSLIKQLIDYNIEDKKDIHTFWRQDS
ncbi:DUF1801 domain-containing protein [Mycoplasmatota bacterium]|nr:DUF1801 domain-containing protein [Mycoplasmatota bacterium]